MSDKIELLPCAFCGANGARMMRNFSQVGGMDHHYLFCDGCGTCGPSGRTEDQALAAWAMRPVDSAPKATHIEWIPMSEQWPPIGEDVLIACAGKGYPDIGADRLDKGDGAPGYDPELYYWQGGEDFSEVTHWAPLPAMPGNTAPPAAEQPDTVRKKLTELDIALKFALCNFDHAGTRRDVKKAQTLLEELRALLGKEGEA